MKTVSRAARVFVHAARSLRRGDGHAYGFREIGAAIALDHSGASHYMRSGAPSAKEIDAVLAHARVYGESYHRARPSTFDIAKEVARRAGLEVDDIIGHDHLNRIAGCRRLLALVYAAAGMSGPEIVATRMLCDSSSVLWKAKTRLAKLPAHLRRTVDEIANDVLEGKSTVARERVVEVVEGLVGR